MRKLYLFLIFGSIMIFSFAHAQPSHESIAESHIRANVPEAADFDNFRLRDLEAYFTKQTGQAFQVKFELLREGPTQTGVAYPKFYLWVRLTNMNKAVQEGAVRVSAIEKKRFEVTNYMSASEIKKIPTQYTGYSLALSVTKSYRKSSNDKDQPAPTFRRALAQYHQ
jgi:hypothetical protein